MTQPISKQILSELSEIVANQIGLHFPRGRWPDLERGVRAAARQLGEPDAESCMRGLLLRPLTRSQIEILASELTVGETYFFRDKRCFEILSELVLPERIRARRETERPLRIWSAGCCTGEEPYSIAISLDRAVPNARDITILGTDNNPSFIHKAGEGVFGEWSFRGAPQCLKEPPNTALRVHFQEVAQAVTVTEQIESLGRDVEELRSVEQAAEREEIISTGGLQAQQRLGKNLDKIVQDGRWFDALSPHKKHFKFPRQAV